MFDALKPPLTPIQVLAHTDFFGGIDAKRLEHIAAISELQQHREGSHIYNLGEPAKNLYVLVDGMVRFAIGFGNRNASAGEILRRGQVFGWAALAPSVKQRIATGTCLSPCTVLAIDGQALNDLMERDNALGFRVMKQLNVLITGTLTAYAAG